MCRYDKLLKIIAMFFFLFIVRYADCNSTENKNFFDFQDMRLEKVFDQITEKTGYAIEISEEFYDLNVTVRFHSQDLDQTLQRVLKSANINNYSIIESQGGDLYEIYVFDGNSKQANSNIEALPSYRQSESDSEPSLAVVIEPTVANPDGITVMEMELEIIQQIKNKPDPSKVILVESTDENSEIITLADAELEIAEQIKKQPDPSKVILIESTDENSEIVTLADAESEIPEQIKNTPDPSIVLVVEPTESNPRGVTLLEVESEIQK